MGSRIIEIGGTALFILLIGLTCLQTFTHVLPEGSLYGVTVDQRRPSLTWRTWWRGEFQDKYEGWIARRIGFKAFWIRTENQINFSLNRRITTAENDAGTQVLLGKDNWLYEKSYVEAYLGKRRLVPMRKIKPVVWGLQQLEAKLAERGIAFLLVISPSKAVTYPEYLPERYVPAAHTPLGDTNYLRTIAALKAYGVTTVDSAALFRRIKPASDYPLFAKGGTHWNHYSAHKVIEEMVISLNPRMARAKMPLPVIQHVELDRPRGADADLGGLINIWNSHATEAPTPYPQFEVAAAKGTTLPAILIVGSSFVWTLIDQMNQADLYERIDFLYYYRRQVTYPGPTEAPFDPDQADWQSLLLEKDAVIMEINEAALPHFRTPFIKDALKQLG